MFEGNRELVRAGLVVLTFGNVSGVDRGENVLAIKPSGVPYEELRPEAIVVVDLETGDVVAGDQRPSSDTPTHLVLYRRFEALGGIVHTHSRVRDRWAQARREIPCFGTTHADHFRGPVPVTRALTADEIQRRLRGANRRRDRRDVREAAGSTRSRCRRRSSHRTGRSPGAPTPRRRSRTRSRSRRSRRWRSDTLVLEAEAPAIDDDLLERHFSRKHGPDAYYGQPR